jgi:hypothetical protein
MIKEIGILKDIIESCDDIVRTYPTENIINLQNIHHEDFFYIYLYLLDSEEFKKKFDQMSILDKFKLLYVCDYLDIQSLLDIIGKSIGMIMKGMSTKELMNILNELLYL